MTGKNKSNVASRARALVERELRALVACGTRQPIASTPERVKAQLDDLLARPDSYRDGMLVLLAFQIESEDTLDLRQRPKGARGVTGYLGKTVLPSLSIAGVKEAFENIAKNSRTLNRGNNQSFDELLAWASEVASAEELQAAFEYLAQGIAATAKSLPALPELDIGRLTFARLASLIDDLFDRPSGGVFQQYVIAALLHAIVDEQGIPRTRLETKGVNVSDRSAGVGADIEYLVGGRVEEAYEVSANPWKTKIPQAQEAMIKRGLERVHLVADAQDLDTAALLTSYPNEDVSVLDVRWEARSLVARLRRQHRLEALRTLYRYLAELQPQASLVQYYVDALQRHGVAIPSALA